MKLSPATPADLAELAEFEREVFVREVYPPFFFRQAHDLWPDWLLIARSEDERLIGYALGAPVAPPGEAWVLSAATHPDYRGQGVGSALLTGLLATFRAVGIRTAWLTVHPLNPALRLYQRHGFVRVSEHADYFARGEPRWRMRLELTA